MPRSRTKQPAPRPTGVGARARVWLELNGVAFLGHGRVKLLESIDSHGSLTQAARAEGVSYRAAWTWIERLNRLAGRPFVTMATGGLHGGGARLTETGKAAVAAYHLLEQRADVMLAKAARDLRKLLGPPPFAPAPRTRRHAR